MITVSIYGLDPSLNEKTDDLTYSWDYMTFTTQLPGGFGSCNIKIGKELYRSYFYLENKLMHGIKVRDSGESLFEGRIVGVTIEPGQLTIDCEGWWGHGKDVFADLLYPSSTPETAESITKDMIALATNWDSTEIYVNPDSVALPNVNGADLDYDVSWHLTNVIEDVCKFGTNESTPRPIYGAVWEDRKVHLKPRKLATVANIDWHISASDFVGGQQGFSVARDGNNFGNSINVIYSNGIGQRTTYGTNAENATSQAKYGIIEKRISISGATEEMALALRDVAIEEYAVPRQSVGAFIDNFVWKGNAQVPVRFVRAGDIVRVHLDPRSTSSVSFDQTRVMFVVATNYNASTGKMRLTLETSPSTFDLLLALAGLGGSRLT